MKMRSPDKEAITRYVDHDNPIDCAGSYKLESLGISLFESVEVDDSTGIIGSSPHPTGQDLRKKAFRYPKALSKWSHF